ncbi:hypothetical protein KI387_009484 [Taxus chinensis]|uniref:Bms1-type G domain-containing protein n=1 Tax=Taxus chinensis TaxID=29808 RepID=A0AA38FJB2_TAXCH|nr:hypothetical protein KI387_009484 [Taxus chinensis]
MEQSHKAHRGRQAGPSVKKKERTDKKKRGISNDKHNPKAFAFNSSVKAKRLQAAAAEKDQRRLHVPTIDRSNGEPAPYVIVVQGPPQVGKTLVIKSLVKHYTKQNLSDVRGPITVVSGKQRRLQFVECPNDMNAMIDAAKFADLVLLLIDGSYGFEMETFEFLNILQVHGFPKVMGVLTHLDKFKDVKKLRKTKQRLKHRFWTEIYDGAKLFYLSGLIHGKYSKREIHNLARFISVAKFRPLSWRTSHPYILVDRFEDVTPPERVHEDQKCDRNVTLYGYLRGCNFKKGTKVHVAGVGDCHLAGVVRLPDPCPLPSAAKKKGLREKEKLFYAPMSDVGDLLYDKDAVYININDHMVQFSKQNDDGDGDDSKAIEAKQGKAPDVGEVLVKTLQNTKYSINEKLEQSFIQLFRGNQRNVTNLTDKGEHCSSEEESSDEEIENDVPSTAQGMCIGNEQGLFNCDALADTVDSGSHTDSSSDEDVTGMKRNRLDRSSDKSLKNRNDSHVIIGTNLVDGKVKDMSDSEEEPPLKCNMREVSEFQDGRVRRRAIFLEEDKESNLKDPAGSDSEDDSQSDKDISESDECYSEDEDQMPGFEEQEKYYSTTKIGKISDFEREPGGAVNRRERLAKDENRDDFIGDASKWKENLFSQTISKKKINLMDIVYGQSASISTPMSFQQPTEDSDGDDSDEEELFKLKQNSEKKKHDGHLNVEDPNADDCTKSHVEGLQLSDWLNQEIIESIRDRVVTGDWSKAARRGEEMDGSDEDDDTAYGDFEDLETGEEYKGGDANASLEDSNNFKSAEEERRLKKLALRAKFDAKYPFCFLFSMILSFHSP